MNLPYEVLIRKIAEEDGGGYMACIPLLGENRCEGYGQNPVQALRDLEQVKRDLFEDYLAKGWEILEPTKSEEQYSGKLLLRIPKILHAQLSHAAEQNGTSLNSYLIYLLSSLFISDAATPQKTHRRSAAG
jgi:predicted HicB family RNase H-like nuclease